MNHISRQVVLLTAIAIVLLLPLAASAQDVTRPDYRHGFPTQAPR